MPAVIWLSCTIFSCSARAAVKPTRFLIVFCHTRDNAFCERTIKTNIIDE